MTVAPAVSVIVPTWNGAATLPALLAAVRRAASRHAVELVAIDSGSADGTVALLHEAGARVLDLGGAPFGHASARNRAAAQARGEVLVWLTQDVEPVGDGWLDPLLESLDDPRVAGAFGRQLPRGASPEEAFLLATNYPDAPRRITTADSDRIGPGRLLFSSAFSAMRRDVWRLVHFPEIVMSEDQAWALAALRAGHEIAYVPAAAAYHGHRFSLGRVFRRNFDSGSSLARLGLAGATWLAGARHLAREVRWIAARHGAAAAAHAIVYESVRMAGFQCGRLERFLPVWEGRLLGEAPRHSSTLAAPRLLPAD
jgi:rhamnosyltransferase